MLKVPSIDPKASGIRRSDGDLPFFLAIRIATGIRSANAPTLFMKAESAVTVPVSVNT